MNKSISLTVDTDDYNALTRASNMLHGMAQDLKNGNGCKDYIDKDKEEKADKISIKNGFKKEETPASPAAPAIVETPASPAAPAIVETPASPAAPAIVELDSEGLPHDSRIHSRNKTKLAKTQQWKKARGVDPQLVLTVEAELRQAMAIPAVPAIVETAITTFPELMAKITAAIGAGTLSNDRINEVCIGKGLASLPLVAARPDLIPAIAAELFPNG